MNAFLVIDPTGHSEVRLVDLKHGADYGAIAAVLRPLFPGAEFERVRVWTSFVEDEKKRYRDMFVDEEGQRKGLPHNVVATAIYRANVLEHAAEPPEPETMPDIRGRAVLFRDPVWS